MRSKRPRGALLVAAGAIFSSAVLGACASTSRGEEAKSPQQIVLDAEHATGSARSVHIRGRVSSGNGPVNLDVVDGQSSGGGIVSAGGLTFRVVLAGNEIYLNADTATWTKAADPSVGRRLGGKWVKTSASNSSFENFVDFLEIPRLVKALSTSDRLTKQPVTSVDGIRVVPVHDDGPGQGLVDVATSGTPYIVAIQGGRSSGIVHFDRYDTAALPSPPARATDLGSVEGAG